MNNEEARMIFEMLMPADQEKLRDWYYRFTEQLGFKKVEVYPNRRKRLRNALKRRKQHIGLYAFYDEEGRVLFCWALFDFKGEVLRTGKKALRILVQQEQDEHGEGQGEE